MHCLYIIQTVDIQSSGIQKISRAMKQEIWLLIFQLNNEWFLFPTTRTCNFGDWALLETPPKIACSIEPYDFERSTDAM